MEDDEPMNTTEDNNREALEGEVAPALISIHPARHSVLSPLDVSFVYSISESGPVTLGAESKEVFHHKGSIRAIRYGAKGKVFLSDGDDTDLWRCLCSVPTEKKVSAVAISDNGQFVCYADKFGTVWLVELDEAIENQASVQKKGSLLLSHYCSIITSLEFSPDGQFIITADRDFKIRVTVFPKKPLNGAHEIQNYCLGHTDQDCPQGYLVFGSGDTTVRLWDFASGLLLHTCDVGSQVGNKEANGTENNHFVVTDLCTTSDGSSVFVAGQSLPGIFLLSSDFSAKTLTVMRVGI
ncbi:putative transcription factor WD40-like family [Helianthus debilis subsp. tardiflorus]